MKTLSVQNSETHQGFFYGILIGSF